MGNIHLFSLLMVLCQLVNHTQAYNYTIGFLPSMSTLGLIYNNNGNQYAGAIQVALDKLHSDPAYSSLNFTYIYRVRNIISNWSAQTWGGGPCGQQLHKIDIDNYKEIIVSSDIRTKIYHVQLAVRKLDHEFDQSRGKHLTASTSIVFPWPL